MLIADVKENKNLNWSSILAKTGLLNFKITGCKIIIVKGSNINAITVETCTFFISLFKTKYKVSQIIISVKLITVMIPEAVARPLPPLNLSQIEKLCPASNIKAGIIINSGSKEE